MTIPLKERPLDIAVVAFFLFNIIFVTYLIDLEQLVISNTDDFEYPLWPPKPLIELMHWYGTEFDPLLMARPVWWRMTSWIDVPFFGPFYCFAIYAFIKGRDWIRMPSIIYASVMLTNVSIILGEEYAGPYASQEFLLVLLANAAWVIFPLLIFYRMWRDDQPFQWSSYETQ